MNQLKNRRNFTKNLSFNRMIQVKETHRKETIIILNATVRVCIKSYKQTTFYLQTRQSIKSSLFL